MAYATAGRKRKVEEERQRLFAHGLTPVILRATAKKGEVGCKRFL
jgi:hypothetical protein